MTDPKSRSSKEASLIPPTPSESEYARLKASDPEGLAEDQAMDERIDPFVLFGEWLALAREREINDPNAMALATADASGLPDLRMVLLKDFDAEGFVFYTNLESAKGVQLAGNPQAALCFHWKSLRRQVRVRGAVTLASAAEADAYFASRARPSQLGAWASDQSRPMETQDALIKRVAEATLKFGLSAPPRPPHWGGFRLVPRTIEFWRDRPFRLHQRWLFERADPAAPWRFSRLYP